jgi:acetyl/propionyl-CoA carboxylase alpha subunit
MVEACARLLLDRVVAAHIEPTGAEFVHARYGWAAAAARFHTVCEKAVLAARGRRRARSA